MATIATTPRPEVDRRWTAIRVGLLLLGVGQAVAAGWALLAPRSFFDDFPGGGMQWVGALPPYNEHLIRDYGASFLALSVLALAAAWIAERRLVRVALAVWVVSAIPHLAFHLAHSDALSAGEAAAQDLTLGLNALLPLLLLALVPKESYR